MPEIEVTAPEAARTLEPVSVRSLKRTDTFILLVKAAAIAGVVFNHVINDKLLPDTLATTKWIGYLFSWCVLAFLAVSGWLHAASETRDSRSLPEYLKARFLRVLVPFFGLILLYSLLWTAVQSLGSVSLRGNVPGSFSGKLLYSLWPAYGRDVAPQLYYLPMLFFISCGVHAVWKSLGERGVFVLGLACYAVALSFFARATSTGFEESVFAWGGAFYAAGFLARRWQHSKRAYALLGGAILLTVAYCGLSGVLRSVPLALLLLHQFWTGPRLPFLAWIGEAAGTIYAYHMPFLLPPLMRIAFRMTTPASQTFAAYALASATPVLCAAAYHSLRKTRLRWALL